MPKQAVTKRSIVKLEGVADAIKNIERVIDRTTAEGLKRTYTAAGMVIADQAKQNIGSVRMSDQGKDVLRHMVFVNPGKAKRPNVLVGVSQFMSKKYAQSIGARWINPYWVEFGTSARPHPITGTSGRVWTPPVPFFRPAVVSSRAQVREVLANGINSAIQTAPKT